MSTENKHPAIIVIRHHEDSCDDLNSQGVKQGPDKWADGYQHVGRALAYYTENNGLCPIGKIFYVAGGGNVGGHWQTPKPKDTATVIAESLSKTYVQDFKSQDPIYNTNDQKLLGSYIGYNNYFIDSIVWGFQSLAWAFQSCVNYISSFFTSQELVLQNVSQSVNDQKLLGDYIGDNNYAGYKAIVDEVVTTMQGLNNQYSILLVGDYNGLSQIARNMEVDPSKPNQNLKPLYKIFQDKIGSTVANLELATPKYWDQWYAMYSIEFDDTGKFLKSGSSLGEGTDNGSCMDKHNNPQKLPNASFAYPYIDNTHLIVKNVMVENELEVQDPDESCCCHSY